MRKDLRRSSGTPYLFLFSVLVRTIRWNGQGPKANSDLEKNAGFLWAKQLIMYAQGLTKLFIIMELQKPSVVVSELQKIRLTPDLQAL